MWTPWQYVRLSQRRTEEKECHWVKKRRHRDICRAAGWPSARTILCHLSSEAGLGLPGSQHELTKSRSPASPSSSTGPWGMTIHIAHMNCQNILAIKDLHFLHPALEKEMESMTKTGGWTNLTEVRSKEINTNVKNHSVVLIYTLQFLGIEVMPTINNVYQALY